jgi:hypothetical protein
MDERSPVAGRALETTGTGRASSIAATTETDRQLRRARRALGRIISDDLWVELDSDSLLRIVVTAESLADRVESALGRRFGGG